MRIDYAKLALLKSSNNGDMTTMCSLQIANLKYFVSAIAKFMHA
jgi:hypothetical protein